MLIKLFHPVEVTESVAPISLPTGCPYGGMPCSVSGWGNTASSGDGALLTTTPSLYTQADFWVALLAKPWKSG